jgi:hypothetical protein
VTKFKKEMGWAEVLAFFALIISCISLWQSSKDGEGHIIQGSGTVSAGTVKAEECVFIIALPIEFNNSGKQSVSLDRFKKTAINPVLFSKDGKIDSSNNIKFEMYFSGNNYPGNIQYFLNVIRTGQVFKPDEKAMIGQLIYPGTSYRKYIALVAHTYVDKTNIADNILIAFDAEFSNGQVLPVRAAIPITPYQNSGCNG